MTLAYPTQQGGAVAVQLADGTRLEKRLDDVVNATADDVLARFRSAGLQRVGLTAMARTEALMQGLLQSDDAGQLAASLSG
jgi:hypothetical protein